KRRIPIKPRLSFKIRSIMLNESIFAKHLFGKKFLIHCLVPLLLLVSTANAGVIRYQKKSDGVSFTLDKGLMYVRIVGDGVVEVRYTALSAWPQKKSLVVLQPSSMQSRFSVSETKDAVVMTTGKLKITVNRQTNAISYADL